MSIIKIGISIGIGSHTLVDKETSAGLVDERKLEAIKSLKFDKDFINAILVHAIKPLEKLSDDVKPKIKWNFNTHNNKSLKKYSLLEMIYEDNNKLDSLTPRQFEIMICELYNKQGYNAELQKQTRDGGKDVIVLHKDFFGENEIYIECKKYASKRAVGTDIIDKIVGVMTLDNITKAIIYTTSYFSKKAKILAEKIKHRLTLFDRKELLEQINQVMCTIKYRFKRNAKV